MAKRVNLLDIQYGQEPSPGTNISDATNWYHYVCEEKQAKKFLIDYFDRTNDLVNKEYFSSVNASDIYMWGATSCWYARMMTIGYQNINLIKFNEYLNVVKSKVERNKLEEKYTAKKSSIISPVAQRLYRNALKALNEICDLIDVIHSKTPRFEPNGIVKILQANGVLKFYQNFIITELNEILADLDSALATGEKFDSETFESYKRIGYSVYLIKKKREYVSLVLSEVDEYFTNISNQVKTVNKISENGSFITEIVPSKKIIRKTDQKDIVKVRKPRKTKPKSMDKLISGLKYLNEYKEFNLISVDPKKIFGCSELWLYNTKYKNLTVLRSKPEQTLTIKGTTVLNFDETSSITKKIGRHTNEILQSVLNNGKVAMRKVMPSINATEIIANGRINKETIILRVL